MNLLIAWENLTKFVSMLKRKNIQVIFYGFQKFTIKFRLLPDFS